MHRLAMVLVVFTGVLLTSGVASAEHRRPYGYCPPPRPVPYDAYRYHQLPHAVPHCYPHVRYHGHDPYRSYRPYSPYDNPYYRYHFGYRGNNFALNFGF